ncbi:hypothetical protein A148_16620 [Vibrio splendidus 1F-157]|nr:hypothetical protein A148_16620 [Vibrio splendidus 1F-157]
MWYMLDLTKLELGDIILESGTTKNSGIIKFWTDSEYSHAMLYVGNSIIHAMPNGVYSKNPQRILVKSKNGLKVLRAKSRLNEKNKEVICNYARNLTGSIYNAVEAGASVVFNKVKKQAITSEQFCSRLVSQSYIQSGISLVKNYDYCSPEEINQSSALKEVTDCVRAASDKEVEFFNSPDPILENQERTFKWLNQARDLFKNKNVNIQTIGDVQASLMNHQELDDEIVGYVQDSKYWQHFNYDTKVNPHRYDLELFFKRFQQSGEDWDWFYGELNKEPAEITRHANSYFTSGLNWVHLNLNFHKYDQELYKNLLLLTKERLNIMKQFSIAMRQPKLVEITTYLYDQVSKKI